MARIIIIGGGGGGLVGLVAFASILSLVLVTHHGRHSPWCDAFVVVADRPPASRRAAVTTALRGGGGIGSGGDSRADGGNGDARRRRRRRRRRPPPPTRRRDVLDAGFRAAASFLVAVSATSSSSPNAAVVLALDFDAFESSEITKDETKSAPILSDDEALCRYGAPGKAMGEACERAGKKPNLPSFVDATGKVDRGDYLKCRYEYPIVGGEYVKTRVCKPSGEWGAP